VIDLITAILAAFRIFFVSRLDTSLEILALRQQLAVLKRRRPRPSVNRLDRFFWTTLRAVWPRCMRRSCLAASRLVAGVDPTSSDRDGLTQKLAFDFSAP
jgi:hypothetical protein